VPLVVKVILPFVSVEEISFPFTVILSTDRVVSVPREVILD